MSGFDLDLFVLGAGSGGVRAARMAAAQGARVAVAEHTYLGGTCVNAGCIPKKLLVYGSRFREAFENAAAYGWELPGRPRLAWRTLRENKDHEIRRLNGVYARLLDHAGVETLWGDAKIVGPHTVSVEGEKYHAEHLLVATGSWPVLPEVAGIGHAITSNEAFHLREIPERVVIVGGGYIAVEFAGIFEGLGAHVTLTYRGGLFLRGFDGDLRETLCDEMRKKGVDVRFDTDVASIERSENGLRVELLGGGHVEADCVMYATGRAPRTEGLGLEEAGVELDGTGAVVVDEYSRTAAPQIFAVGDCTNRMNLTPVAIAEAMAFVDTVFNEKPTPPDYRNVPSAIFSQPEAATVGLSEERAREEGYAVDVYRTGFRPLEHTMTGVDERTMMKLVVCGDTERVLGCHMVGPHAAEIVQGFAVAMKCGATKEDFDRTVGLHPTAAEEFVTMRDKVPGP